MESGNPVNYNSFRPVEYYQPLYDSVVNGSGCYKTIDTLECLRHVPFSKLNDLFNTSTATYWQPVVDGDFIARWASIQLKEGDFVKVPIIDGANTDEGTAFGPPGANSSQEFIAEATSNNTSTFIGTQFASGLLNAYPNTPAYWIPVRILTALTFCQPAMSAFT